MTEDFTQAMSISAILFGGMGLGYTASISDMQTKIVLAPLSILAFWLGVIYLEL